MRNYLLSIIIIFFSTAVFTQPTAHENLVFDSLTKCWDEAIPLGNGWLGALIWQKEDKLRISLDRVDLWDDRPMPGIDKLRFKWVAEQVQKMQYDTVQKAGDEPYEKYAAPTKIPGAALEFDCSKFGKVISNELDIKTALSVIKFENGVVFNNYIHATNQVGYFGFENCAPDFIPSIIIPLYNSSINRKATNSVEGQGLERLGYAKGTVTKGNNFLRYHQPTYNGNYYEVLVQWTKLSKKLIGQWTITSNKKATLPLINFALKEPTGWDTHNAWWNNYWSRSSITIPDTILAKQYYLEMYKFGSVARSDTPPISLQAIWTADNGNLPPWKGDFHHDLNTELSYWPGYTGNHLDLTSSFTNWLWKVRTENIRWTKQYFGADGLNVPGVTTISGRPMGGWIQYSMSPTTAAWLAQHFYWQWKYSMDEKFLKERCRPYFDGVENYLFRIRITDNVTKQYNLPLSSSPEYNDNSIKAWFRNFTNYDLALVKNLSREYTEVLDRATGRNPRDIFLDSKLYPDLDTNETGLTIASGQNLEVSHRHHAHLMAIHPLAMLNPDIDAEKSIMDKSLRWLEKKGTREWCGYSFSWAACLYARAREGDNAAKMLKIFANNFVSVNSFHLNGDQRGGQYSNFTYRPFTLEGNFAFAQGIHEMLLQTNNGYIEIFPAIPASWKNASFKTLRTEGAFLISAIKENGSIMEVKITSTAGGPLRLRLPFKTFIIDGAQIKYELSENILLVNTRKGQTIMIKNGFE
ncbi:MAG: glycoside hydrolase family 95-like protein [Ferruginibacter sp.]